MHIAKRRRGTPVLPVEQCGASGPEKQETKALTGASESQTHTTQHRALLVRLYPTREQAEKLAQYAGACRFVYNLALSQRRTFGRKGRGITWITQCRELTALRTEVDWLRAVPCHMLQQSLRDLDTAYKNFFAKRAGYPKFHGRDRNNSFRVPDSFSAQSAGLKIPKSGLIKLRGWRDMPGVAKNVTISCRAGRWFAAIMYESKAAAPAETSLPSVGIDVGIRRFAALSDGTIIAPGNFGKKRLAALRRAQRSLSRKKKGSANRRKAALRVARLHMRASNARKDFLHKHSTNIARNYGTVAMEAVKVKNMSASAAGTVDDPGSNVEQKSGLNRAILDQGWGSFRIMLGYKLAARGGKLIEVPPPYTSQTCAACSLVCAESRAGHGFKCVGCGHAADADVNAAVNILRRAGSPSKPVEGNRAKRPVEAGRRLLAA